MLLPRIKSAIGIGERRAIAALNREVPYCLPERINFLMTAEWWTVLFAGVTAAFTCHLPRKAAEKKTERKT
jgi:hypothetical protein